MSMESHGEMILTGEKRRIRRKSYPSATLSITNPTWTDPGVNPDLHGERPATNRLSHGTALFTKTRYTTHNHEGTRLRGRDQIAGDTDSVSVSVGVSRTTAIVGGISPPPCLVRPIL
jgi:hypothetical protein